ncbi:hypothetical protein HGRIS_007703 [Hohenbuehelia grisea]|uniref:RNI-like protein n=1 Tax=Hohenbuehelia grisea TaxID=104357 RepID=A0ABR3J6F6_9AGAR
MPPRKKKKTKTISSGIGEPSEDDLPSARNNNPFIFASSTRPVIASVLPPLSSLCVRVFAENIQKLYGNSTTWPIAAHYLKILPDPLLARVFAMLRMVCPTLLSAEFVTTYFFRGSVMILDNSMPGVEESTIQKLKQMGSELKELELTGFEKFSDTAFASAIAELPSLRKLILRGCSQVGAKTLAAMEKHCGQLSVINLNNTAATPVALLPILLGCGPKLEVLKVAGISNWTDATFSRLSAGLDDNFKLPLLHTLKLRGLSLSDASINILLALCPNLRRLDASFTPIKHPPILSDPSTKPKLQKLSLTSTQLTMSDLVSILSGLSDLRTLSVGALGGGQATSAAMGNSSAMTMTDETLRAMTGVLAECPHLDNVNLAGNVKLGVTGRYDRALETFILRVGRKCKILKLAGIPSLQSKDLAGLMPADEGNPCRLKDLNLNNTNVDDTAAVFISTCSQLETLSVQKTKFTSEGLFTIIDACPQLANLDLTSCRGVSLADRRRFFEVWHEAQQDDNEA